MGPGRTNPARGQEDSYTTALLSSIQLSRPETGVNQDGAFLARQGLTC